MAIHTLHQLFAESNAFCRDMLREAENQALWNSVSIAREGREPELRKLKALYNKLKDIHERSAFSDPDCLQRTAVLATAEVFRRTGAPAVSDTLIEHVERARETRVEARPG